jgi:DNA-directed RNA polymerase subunit M/transcription elongation factor TFIIS
MVFYFKACTKCNGDLYESNETDEIVLKCFQCSTEYSNMNKAFKRNSNLQIENIRADNTVPDNQSNEFLTLDDYFNMIEYMHQATRPLAIRKFTPLFELQVQEGTIKDSLDNMVDFGWVEKSNTTRVNGKGTSTIYKLNGQGSSIYELIAKKNEEFSIRSTKPTSISDLMDSNRQLTERGNYIVRKIEELALFVGDTYHIDLDDSEDFEETTDNEFSQVL